MGLRDLLRSVSEAPELQAAALLDRMCPKCRGAAITTALRLGRTRLRKCEEGNHAK